MWKGMDNCHYWMADMAAYLYLAYWMMTKRARPQGQAVPEGSMPRQLIVYTRCTR
jgi:hypothetical protein